MLAGILLFLLSAWSFAQDKQKDVLYLIHTDFVIPSMVPQYESAVTKLAEQFKKHDFGMDIQFVSSTDDNVYYYLTPLNSYADLDNRQSIWADLNKKAGEETMAAIDKEFEGCYKHHNSYIVRWSAELSYQPKTPRLKQEEVKFIHWDYYYIEEGKEGEAIVLAKKYNELWEKNNVGDGYNVWIADIGHPMGLMVVTQSAKDAADYYTQGELMQEMMGDEINALNAEFLPLMKDFEQKNGKPHPEFTYVRNK